jgi:hypothetical protein
MLKVDNYIMDRNRIIAEFMGGLWNEHSKQWGIGRAEYFDMQLNKKTLKNVVRAEQHFSNEDLKYHESWNWLMPVVEKIESFDGLSVHIEGCFCAVNHIKEEAIVQVPICTLSKIEATFETVIKFIEWYNEQSK